MNTWIHAIPSHGKLMSLGFPHYVCMYTYIYISNINGQMGKSTISMAIFNSKLLVYITRG